MQGSQEVVFELRTSTLEGSDFGRGFESRRLHQDRWLGLLYADSALSSRRIEETQEEPAILLGASRFRRDR